MIVVLEGPDGAGKTTLLNDPQFFPTFATAHMGPPTATPPLTEYVTAIQQYDNQVKFDRLHLGERVYGPLFRGTDRLGDVGQRMVERVLLSRAAVTIICLPPYDVALQQWKARKAAGGELVTDESVYREIYHRYAALLNASSSSELPTLHYDYTTDAPIAIATDAARIGRLYVNPGPGIGRFRLGATLLVGDEVNHNVAIGNYPFVATTGSSVWLTQGLIDHQVKERSLYWINRAAADVHTAHRWLEPLAPTKVVALGKNAAKWCEQVGQSCVEMPHPAFWSRFHHGEVYPLWQVLA